MPTHDKQKRPYAKLSELKAGDVVTVDGDFTCIEPWSQRTVYEDEQRNLCIECDEGSHALSGQADDDGEHLIGVYQGKLEL